MAGIGSHTKANRGATDTWLTPPGILLALGEFDLDPCCPPNMPWPTAKKMLTPEHDGLSAEWQGRVWLNPPYGPETERWLEKLAKHGRGTALIFARTETACWFEHVWPKASAVLFIKGRLHFHSVDGSRAKGNAGGPSALVAYGEDALGLRLSEIDGQFIGLRERIV